LPKLLTDILAVGVPIVALVISLASLSFSRRAIQLSERQEKRKQPLLVLELDDSYFEVLQGGRRIYSFHLSVKNPSDSDNAIARVDMHLRYVLDSGISITAKLPAVELGDKADTRKCLVAPLRVSAHDTVLGWCDFIVEPGVLNGHQIEAYQIVVSDSQDAAATIEPLVVQMKQNET
jgi:hypothetical protein